MWADWKFSLFSHKNDWLMRKLWRLSPSSPLSITTHKKWLVILKWLVNTVATRAQLIHQKLNITLGWLLHHYFSSCQWLRANLIPHKLCNTVRITIRIYFPHTICSIATTALFRYLWLCFQQIIISFLLKIITSALPVGSMCSYRKVGGYVAFSWMAKWGCVWRWDVRDIIGCFWLLLILSHFYLLLYFTL